MRGNRVSAETRAAVTAAIQAHIFDEYGADGGLVVDWVVAAGTSDGVEHGVGVEYSRDPMPTYIAVGLLSEAMDVVAE